MRKFLPPLSQYLSPFACFVFNSLRNIARLSLLLFCQVDGHLAAYSCISKVWDWLFEYIVHRPLRSPHFIQNSPEAAATLCVCVLTLFHLWLINTRFKMFVLAVSEM